MKASVFRSGTRFASNLDEKFARVGCEDNRLHILQRYTPVKFRVRVTGGSGGESERAQALVVPNIYQSSAVRSQRNVNTARLKHTPQIDSRIHMPLRIVFTVRPTPREDVPLPTPIVALPVTLPPAQSQLGKLTLPMFETSHFGLPNGQVNTTTRSLEGQLDIDISDLWGQRPLPNIRPIL
jgi:hypothetical protein